MDPRIEFCVKWRLALPSSSSGSGSLLPPGLELPVLGIVLGILPARIQKCVAILFLRGSSLPKDRNWASCIMGRFLTVWATGKLPNHQTSIHERMLSHALTLCDPMDYSPPGSSVHGILQAKTLEWVAISSSRGPPWPMNQILVSCISYTSGGFFTCWAVLYLGHFIIKSVPIPLTYSISYVDIYFFTYHFNQYRGNFMIMICLRIQLTWLWLLNWILTFNKYII